MGRMTEHDPARSASADRPVVFFHIGAPKTGTTFLQRILWQNRDRLAELGVCYPGETFGAHVQGAFDLRGAGFHGYRDPGVPGAWQAMVEPARDFAGRAVFSQELFSPATPAQIEQAMSDLSFADVHLVYTARELTRQIPAAWQEDLKNRFTISFDDFVVALRDRERDTQGLGRMFWRMQDAAEVLARWGRNLPSDHVHVVTVPQRAPDPDVLWRRFADVIGIDPASVDISGAFQNTSLGAAEAQLLYRLNGALDDEVGWPLYAEMIKHHLSQEVLVHRRSSARIALPVGEAEWVRRRAIELVDRLRAAKYDVVGSLDDLVPAAIGPADDYQAPSVDEQLDVAVEAIAALLLRISRLRRGVVNR